MVAAFLGAIVGVLIARPSRPHPFEPRLLASPMAISFYLWVVLSIYWGWAARNSSTAKSEESGGSRALHLLMVNGAMLLAFWPFPGWPVSTTNLYVFPRVLPSEPYLAPIGLALAAASLLLALWARRHLGRNWSGAVTVKVDHELVRSGPYRRIRHPIYTGAIGMYVGTALISGRLQGILALALVSIAYARKIQLEERNLRQEFGPAFDEYCHESWALIPGIL